MVFGIQNMDVEGGISGRCFLEDEIRGRERWRWDGPGKNLLTHSPFLQTSSSSSSAADSSSKL